MIHEADRNRINGILGTIAFHLLILVAFLFLKLGKVKTEHRDAILIEFTEEEYKPIEQIIEENKPDLKEMPNLSQEVLKNIAVNTSEEVNEEISTEKYIEEVMEELGMEEMFQNLSTDLEEADVSLEPEEDKNVQEEKARPKGRTLIEYYLENRRHRYLYRPAYKCQGGGKVTVEILVDRLGRVSNASILEASTQEVCLIETAIQSARSTTFNIDNEADSKQKGTITYTFIAQ